MPTRRMHFSMANRFRSTSVQAAGALFLVLLVTLGVASCSSTPSVRDGDTTRDSLAEVSESPAVPEADDPYDAQLHPDPIVEPLPCSAHLVITVRGTGEPPENQLLTPVADGIAQSIADTDIVDLDYPADTEVREGGTHGVRQLLDTIRVQTAQCPLQKLVLLGYSQGAFVIGDALSAPEDRMIGTTAGEIDATGAAAIAAVVLYGDPRFVGSESYDAGDYLVEVNGLLPRPAGALEGYTERLRDFCSAADFICQSQLDLSEDGHVSYFTNGMPQEGVEFVVALLNDATLS